MNKRIAIFPNEVFDGTHWLSYKNGIAVCIVGNKISFVGPKSMLPEGKWEIINIPDCTLIPGLIDMHVHLTMDGSAESINNTLSDDPSTAMIRTINNAKKQILQGITFVRDCGCQGNMAIELGNAVKLGLLTKSPKVAACGQALCITGGHGAFIGYECDGANEFLKAARQMVKKGASFLKIISTGGVISKGTKTDSTQMNFEEIKTVVDIAKDNGISVVAHAHGTKGIKLALQAGVSSIEHASYIDDECIDLFIKNNAMFTSTLLASQRELDHSDKLPAFISEKIHAHISREQDSVRRLIQAGVPALGGTDSGTPYNPHGNLVQQLIMLSEHGLESDKVLMASTSLAAKALNMDDEIGYIKEGYAADIIAVCGPLKKQINALYNITNVWRDGIPIVK